MKLRMTQAAEKSPLAILSDTGQEISDREVRDSMLGAFRAGQLHSLRFNATVWTNNGKNKNNYEFPDGELEAFASSFAGMPLLKDHTSMQDARGGTILESKLIDVGDGKKGIRQRIEAVKPWAIESALDGTLDRFSIGWDADEHLCTVCGTDILACAHGPWKLGTKDKETGKTVGLLWKGISGVETSGVTHPAAPGTTTEEVMAALAAAADLRGIRTYAFGNPAGAIESEDQMLEKILSSLGLPAGTKEPEALSALEVLKARPTVASKAVLGALGVPEAATENDVVTRVISLTAGVSREEHERVAGELAATKTDEIVRAALAAGKITPANEEWARGWAKADPTAFASWVEKAPRQIPLNSVKPDTTETPKKRTLTTEQAIAARAFGMSPEEFLAAEDEVKKSDETFAARYGN